MGKIKKIVFVGVTATSGLLLTLAGLNLIELSSSLILYSGLGLLSLAVVIYFVY